MALGAVDPTRTTVAPVQALGEEPEVVLAVGPGLASLPGGIVGSALAGPVAAGSPARASAAGLASNSAMEAGWPGSSPVAAAGWQDSPLVD